MGVVQEMKGDRVGFIVKNNVLAMDGRLGEETNNKCLYSSTLLYLALNTGIQGQCSLACRIGLYRGHMDMWSQDGWFVTVSAEMGFQPFLCLLLMQQCQEHPWI